MRETCSLLDSKTLLDPREELFVPSVPSSKTPSTINLEMLLEPIRRQSKLNFTPNACKLYRLLRDHALSLLLRMSPRLSSRK